ncbi:hypothetical protein [Mycolicibacterium iranicum]|uniref:Uncharacterized protein n=1 Tax=Mycolicibacterium iranicum TaxID=912594 RepID=A0A178LZP8_MYCIR|nr:hypothetical protein [Mycolicibacterium iranicum]OAN40298.1 hypothetical protein A4X20_14335 [Mycolicibacterium iranicum]
MNEHTCTLHTDVHTRGDTLSRSPADVAVISVAEVMLGSAAASAAAQRGIVREWWAQLVAIRVERRRIARRRPDYFEHAAMAREMYRL